MLEIIDEILANRYQKVVINEQDSRWIAVNDGFLQGSTFGSLLFLVYIKGLSAKLSSHHTSLFSVVRDGYTLVNELNDDSLKIKTVLINGK